MRKAVVALAGTLDTKSTEYEFVKNEIIKFGCDVLVIDTGIFGGGSLEADIKNDVVAREGGVELSDFAARVEGDTLSLIHIYHGKSMSQLEGCRRGGSIFSTETTVTDDEGTALYGSTNVYIRKRAKGTERSDLPSQDEGVLKFWDKEPEMTYASGPLKIDLAVMPGIDGHFDTQVTPMGNFEKCYQSFHSLMNFFGLNQLLCGETGLVMPILDTDERRQKRGEFLKKFCEPIPYYMIRAKSPQILFDEIEKLL